MRSFSILLLLLFHSGNLFAWGFFAHKWINQIAVYTLPYELYGFYRNNINLIRERAVNPDMRRYVVESEGFKHYLDVDQYENALPLDTLPRNYRIALDSFGKDSLWEHGVGPWNVTWTYNSLVDAFAKRDEAAIINLSADLGHYIADLHVPLHTTSNYNGQQTGQYGIHGLWESRLPELFFGDYDLISGKSEYISDIPEHIWTVLEQSHALVDSVLSIEKYCSEKISLKNKYGLEYRSSAMVEVYTRKFCLCYAQSLNGMVERRMRAAIQTVGSYWYSAWVDAGQPVLDSVRDTSGVVPEKRPENAIGFPMLGRQE